MTEIKTTICAIAAMTRDGRVIGNNGSIPWYIPEDFEHFKKVTTGHPVIMGQRTWDSLPNKARPLPERTNIVLTLDSKPLAGAIVVNNIPNALSEAKKSKGAEEIFIIGGGSIYKQFLPYVEKLYLTLVEKKYDGDTLFPEFEPDFKLISEEKHDGFSFCEFKRVV